jgi:hypothetical protein
MKIYCFLLSILLLASCAVPSDFSTGRVVPVGETEVISMMGFSNFSNQKAFLADTIMDIKYSPSFIVQTRGGISDKLDIGLKLESPILTTDLDIKYQYLGNYDSQFAASAYLGLRAENFINFHVGFGTNVSWQVNKFVEIFASPKYLINIKERNNEYRNYFGLSTGLHLGSKESFKIVITGSFFKDQSNFIDLPLKDLSQFAVGVKFKSNRIRKPWLIF